MKRLMQTLLALSLALFLVGCSQEDGSVQVDVGTAALANVYRVDLYAREQGLDLVEGTHVGQGQEATLDQIPPGEWALLIQAQNGDGTTVAYYQAQVTVSPGVTTQVTAGLYRPGVPGDPLPESASSLESFGPNGEVLLSALYGPAVDGLPAASVDLELINGPELVTANRTTLGNRVVESQDVTLQCGTCFISPEDIARGNESVRAQEVRPQISTIATGGTLDFFVATSFQTVTCQRILTDAQTQNCLIFAELVNGTPVLSEATALAVVEGFEQDNPFQDGDAGIYNDTRARFGSEWTADGGRDGDSRVVLVYLSSASIGGEGLFGFVNPVDQRSKDEAPSSNEGEILYLNAQRTTSDLYDGLSTISHELVHLILQNQKVSQNGTFPEGASSENAVLDEGLAVLNEELCGFGFTGDQGGNFFLLSSVSGLLDSGLNRRYFQFGGQLADYGAGYFFWRYVHDQLGLEVITTLATSTQTGRVKFALVLKEPFEDFFQRYTQALASSGRTGLAEEFQFTNLDLFATYSSREGVDFNLSGLQDLRTVTLPGTLLVNEAVEPWGTIFYTASGGDGSALSWKAVGAEGLTTGLLEY